MKRVLLTFSPLLAACTPDVETCSDADLEAGSCGVNLQQEAYDKGYAKAQEEVDAKIDAKLETLGLTGLEERVDTLEDAGYITEDALSGYATESWVTGQDYATNSSLTVVASDVSVIQNDVSAIQGDVLDLQGDVSTLQSDVSTLQSSMTAADLAILTLQGDVTALLSDTDTLRTDMEGLIVDTSDMAHVISADTTYTVANETELIDALAALNGYLIASDVTVTIQLTDNTYVMPDTITINHRDGNRIEILGNTSDPSRVVLQFAATSGIEVKEGAALGYLDGITIVGDGTSVDANGVYVHSNAFLECGPDVVVTDFAGYGFYAKDGGVLFAEGTTATNNAVG